MGGKMNRRIFPLVLFITLISIPVFGQDTLTTPISKTATSYRITTIGFSITDKAVSVGVDFLDSKGTVVDNRRVVFQGADYPQAAADSLVNVIKKALANKGTIN